MGLLNRLERGDFEKQDTLQGYECGVVRTEFRVLFELVYSVAKDIG